MIKQTGQLFLRYLGSITLLKVYTASKLKGVYAKGFISTNSSLVLLPSFHKNHVVITKESEEKVIMIARLPNSENNVNAMCSVMEQLFFYMS